MEGGCACGEVRYRLGRPPLFVHCCHCLNCQRQTGAAFAINVLIERDQVESLAREPDRVPVPRSGTKRQQIYRCPVCETAVWSTYTRKIVLLFAPERSTIHLRSSRTCTSSRGRSSHG